VKGSQLYTDPVQVRQFESCDWYTSSTVDPCGGWKLVSSQPPILFIGSLPGLPSFFGSEAQWGPHYAGVVAQKVHVCAHIWRLQHAITVAYDVQVCACIYWRPQCSVAVAEDGHVCVHIGGLIVQLLWRMTCTCVCVCAYWRLQFAIAVAHDVHVCVCVHIGSLSVHTCICTKWRPECAGAGGVRWLPQWRLQCAGAVAYDAHVLLCACVHSALLAVKHKMDMDVCVCVCVLATAGQGVYMNWIYCLPKCCCFQEFVCVCVCVCVCVNGKSSISGVCAMHLIP